MNRTSHHDVAMYKGIKLFAGTGSPNLAQLVSDYINVPLSGREIIEFPNENLFVKLSSSVRGQDVYVIQTTTSPVHRNLMELLILIQTLKLDSAARITAIMPYLAYCRSDKKDQPRVPITARLVADMIGIAGADRYMILDPHAGQVQGFFSVPGDVLTGFHLISDHLKMLTPKMVDPVVVTVDLGFAKKGRNIAADLNAPIAFIEKRRSANDANAQALSIIGNVANRDVILVDDEIDTGGSIIQAVNLLKSNGALNVYIVCIHAVLSLNAAEKLSKLPFTQFITTDTVPIPENKAKFLQDRLTILSVAPLIGEVILRAHEGRSVGEMFNE
ncbi:MAG TPA: ribose-phosphate pyrophosphokinase [Anaerolineales bacterium]|nr:ribose-phosphate pyrophosphokinase [Anaerolineales bacterium]